MAAKRILWMSRHKPFQEELDELESIFGKFKLTLSIKRFFSANEVVQKFIDGNFDDIVIVAPHSVLDRITQLGLTPLFAVMRDKKFVGFKRLVGVTFHFTNVQQLNKSEVIKNIKDKLKGGD